MSITGINPKHYPARHGYAVLTILDGSTQSQTIDISGLHVVALQRPANSGIASLHFDVSHNGQDWVPLRNADDADVSLVIGLDAAQQRISSIMDFEGAAHIRLRSNVAVSADQSFTLIMANI